MLAVEFIIVLLAIFIGARLGGIGIGFAGGLGVLVLAAIGVKPGTIPFDVISIIMAVIAAISAMQIAGGLDYLVDQTENYYVVIQSTSLFLPHWSHIYSRCSPVPVIFLLLRCLLSLKLPKNKVLSLAVHYLPR